MRPMKNLTWSALGLFVATAWLGCGPPPPLTPPPPAPEYDAPADPGSSEAAGSASGAGNGSAVEDDEAKKLVADFAAMEKAAAEQKTRLSTEEVEKEAQTLVAGMFGSTKAAVAAALAGSHRAPGNAARDGMRHPAETLEFFGFRAKQNVFEYGPGAGWYTEILAPVVAKNGKLHLTIGDPKGPRTERSTYYAVRTQRFLESSKTLYGKVDAIPLNPPNFPLGQDGKLDLALVIRGMHGMVNRKQIDAWLASIHEGLKPGGTLGIVQHRAEEGADPTASAKDGYLPEKWVIEKVTAAGFELTGKSELNANPKDTKDHPEGVWTLPPTLRLGDQDRAKYEAIGESDRMTLKFRKVVR